MGDDRYGSRTANELDALGHQDDMVQLSPSDPSHKLINRITQERARAMVLVASPQLSAPLQEFPSLLMGYSNINIIMICFASVKQESDSQSQIFDPPRSFNVVQSQKRTVLLRVIVVYPGSGISKSLQFRR